MRTIALAVLVSLSIPSHVVANEPDTRGNESPFEINLAIDLSIIAISGVVGLMPELISPSLGGPWCGLDCDPADLNGLDRSVVGNHSAASRTASDALVVTNLALPHIAGLIDVLVSNPADGFAGYGKDTVVLFEALAVTALLNQLIKYSVRRPRPLVYDDNVEDEERLSADAALSFYSMHTSVSFTMATAYSYIFMKRHPGSPWVIPVWVGTHGLAATTAALRVSAGKHFWTDVLTGAAIGSAIGFVVPYIHSMLRERSSKTAASSFSVSPLVFEGGGGVSISLR